MDVTVATLTSVTRSGWGSRSAPTLCVVGSHENQAGTRVDGRGRWKVTPARYRAISVIALALLGIIVVSLLWGFALVAGFSASVVRAVTMFTFVAYALYLNRPSNTFNILALSMFFILLLINPMLLFQVGFQMSYAAVFAIVWIYPLLQRLWFPKNVVVRKLWQLLSVSVAAQLGVLPISLFYFHQFAGLFFITNLAIVPFLGLVLGMGILVIILSLLNLLPDFLVRAWSEDKTAD